MIGSMRLDTKYNDYLTPEAQKLVNNARDMIPTLQKRADAADKNMMVSKETVAEMQEADLFKVLQPKRWGGYECDPRVFGMIQMNLAQGCMSTAWMYGVVAVHNWQIPLYPEQAQQEVWGDDPTILTASTYMPVGKTEKVDGGYKLSGHWGFSTGCDHVQWYLLGGLLPALDNPDALEHTTFLVHKDDVEIVRNWDVLGLRGTGSHDVVVKDAFVPEYRTQRTNNHTDAGCPGRATNPGWLYKIPFTQVFQRAVSTSCIGALEGAVNSFSEYASSHMGKHGNKTAEDVNAQQAVAEATMAVDYLKLVLLRNFDRIVECAHTGERMPIEERLMQRAQSSAVPKITARHIDDLLRASAASGMYKPNPIERIFRDIHNGRGHIANNSDAYSRAAGAVQLGLPNMDPFV